MYITAQCGAGCSDWTSNYSYYDYPDWVVPANTTEIIFEIGAQVVAVETVAAVLAVYLDHLVLMH